MDPHWQPKVDVEIHRVTPFSRPSIVEAYERRDEPVVEVSSICQRLREVSMAQGFMDEGLSLKQAARRLMVTAEHLRKQLGLLKRLLYGVSLS